MKKVSTVATKQGGNVCRQKLTIGLDLGDRNSWYCVLDEAGRIQLEQRVRTTAKALQEVFGAMPRSRIGLEIGTHSPWISRLLGELGHELIVANARKVRLIGESRKKDDRLDAQALARLARIDPELLYPVKHRSAQAQADLAVIRARAGLVRARTGLVNTARGLAKSYRERLRGCNVRNMDPEKAEGLSPELQRALEPLLSAIEQFDRLVELIPEPYATMVYVAIYTGLRVSELLDSIRKHRVVKKSNPTDLVFQSVWDGKEMRDNNILVRFIKPAARKLNLDWVNWLSLRTSHGTWLKMAGADVKDAQGQMRHSRASTTLDFYQQFVPESQQRVIEKLPNLPRADLRSVTFQ